MPLLNVAVPVLGAVAEYLLTRKADVAKQTGISEDAVGKVASTVNSFLTQDERAQAAVMAEITKARETDERMNTANTPPIVQLLRGLVRPVITLTAFGWYVLARAQGIELGAEDYAIIGGIMAFWFGFRPFEKGNITPSMMKK